MSRAEIKGRMSMDAKGVKVGTDSAKKHVSGFEQQLGSLKGAMAGAFSVGAIVAFGKAVASYGGNLSDAAFQTQLATDEFQAFRAAARDGGADLSKTTNGLISLRDAQLSALDGEQMYSDAFANLNITLDDLANMTMPQLLEAVAKGARETGDFGAIVDLFGKRNAAKLEEALYVLADEGFPALIDSMTKAGEVMDEKMIAKLDAAADKMDQLKDRFLIAGAAIVGPIERAFTRIGAAAEASTAKHAAFKRGLGSGMSIKEAREYSNQVKKDTYSGVIEGYVEEEMKVEDRLRKQRERREEVNHRARKAKIKALYELEAQEAGKVEEKKTDSKKKLEDSFRPSSLEAADSMARIGGKVGGQADNTERRLQDIRNHLAKIEQNTKPDPMQTTLKISGV